MEHGVRILILLAIGFMAFVYTKSRSSTEERLGAIEASVKSQPARAYQALARYYLSLRRKDEALAVVSEALLVISGNASLHRLRAVARYASGDATGAVEDLRKVLELEPGDVESRRKLDEILPRPAPSPRE